MAAIMLLHASLQINANRRARATGTRAMHWPLSSVPPEDHSSDDDGGDASHYRSGI